jgi:hypothetical protein
VSKTESFHVQILELARPSSVTRLSRDYRASAADRDRLPKMKPFIQKPCKFVLVRQSPRREA